MTPLTIVKIGGNIIDKPYLLEEALKAFQTLRGPKILIHGGGALASELSAKLGIKVKMIEGRRVTDFETLKLTTMVYAGLINKQIIAQLQKIGCNSIGLSGADGNIIPATKRSPSPIDFGYVGDINPQLINNSLIINFLGRGICPVFCAITHDGNGNLLNTNADTLASSIAIALSKEYCTKLIYCFEKEGVMSDVENPDSIIPLITYNSFIEMKNEGKIKDGMIPKLTNAFAALKNGVCEVEIKHARNLNNPKGTVLKYFENV